MFHLLFSKVNDSVADTDVQWVSLRFAKEGPLHNHDFYEFFIVINGGGHHLVNGKKLSLQPGSLCFVRPWDTHGFLTHGDTVLCFYNVAFSTAWWERLGGLLPRSAVHRLVRPPFPPLAVLGPAELQARAEGLGELIRSRSNRALLFLREAFAVLSHLARTESGGGGTSAPSWLKDLVVKIRQPEHFTQGIAHMYKLSGRSREHFARECRRYLGMSPTELINQVRIDFIKNQLLYTDEKIIQLALDAGYQNISYFCRVFRKLAGCSPRQWRKTGRTVV